MVSLFWARDNKSSLNQEITVLIKETGNVESFVLEDYLFGVLAGEMPASFPKEALKAQAVAARTYALNKMQEKNDVHPDADLCTDSAHCKAWLSDEQITEKFGKDWFKMYEKTLKSAIKETEGEIMVFNEEPILAVFHSTNGGRTENSADVWGGELPYLQSVESHGDEASPKYTSDVTVSIADFEKAVGSTKISDIIRSDGGSVKSITIGDKTFKGTEIRSLFSLNSSNFEIEALPDAMIFHVTGYGHGIGMSQYGAKGFAEEGYSYKDILKNYYSGIEFKKI